MLNVLLRLYVSLWGRMALHWLQREQPFMALAFTEHPQFRQAVEWLESGMDSATVATKLQPKVNRTTVWRYWANRRKRIKDAAKVPSTVVSALEERGLLKDGAEVAQLARVVADATETVLAADPYIARMEQLRADRQRVKDMALQGEKPDLRTWSALDRNDLTEIELHARFSGRLESGQRGGDVNLALIVGIPRAAAAPEPPRQLPSIDVECIDVEPS
jgi:hypothetical protein